MARRLIHPHSPEIIEAVRAFGIDPNDVQSIDLHIDTENVPTITITVMPKATDAPKIANLLAATAAGRRDVNILPADTSTSTCEIREVPAGLPCVLRWGHDSLSHEDQDGHRWPVRQLASSPSRRHLSECGISMYPNDPNMTCTCDDYSPE